MLGGLCGIASLSQKLVFYVQPEMAPHLETCVPGVLSSVPTLVFVQLHPHGSECR